MGVLGLWSILEAAGSAGSSEQRDDVAGTDAASAGASGVAAAALPSRALSLAAQIDSESQSRPSTVLCVDLSVWLMEANVLSTKIQHSAAAAAAAAASSSAAAASAASSFAGGGGGPASNPKHYLVYLLQRVCAFLRNSIRLIFVTDGRAPLLKTRIAAGGKDDSSSSVAAASGSAGFGEQQQRHRSKQDPRWVAQIRESTRLLSLLDLPVLSLERGEAEALAAALNSRGLCDGVLTTDGDAFLFGARRVLKNLEASSSALCATSVDMLEIKQTTGLDREALVMLALLLGSDYTSGVRSLGPRKAIKYLRVLQRASRAGGIEAAAAAAASPAAASSGAAAPVAEQHPLMRIFRAVIDAATPEDAVAMLLRCHEEGTPHAAASSSAAAAAAASFSSAAATSAVTAASSSSPSIDYASLSLPELKAQMAAHGLKAQPKAAMVAKLQQIASRSQEAAAAAATSLSPSPPPSAHRMVLSDSDDDELDLPAAASSKPSKPGRRPKSGAASSKQRQASLSSFLYIYVPKIHARYHAPRARREMELIIASYLRPELHPKVEVLEKAIHSRIPAPNFMALRDYLSSDCGLGFVRFEKLYLPVELHLHLWSLQHAAWRQAQCEEALRAMQEDTADQELDDDVIECTPPTRGEKAATTGAPPSSTSTVPLSGSSSSSAAATNSLLPLYYTPAHISKRRVIAGCACFVIVWTKTALGARELATLPQSFGSTATTTGAAAAGGATAEPEGEQAEEEEMDLTGLTQSPVIAPQPTGSPHIISLTSSSSSAAAGAPAAAAASSSGAAAAVFSASGAAAASSKRLPLQDTTMHLYECPEPAWFVRACLPAMVAAFEAQEAAALKAKEHAKELSKIEKQAAKDAKEQAKKRAAAVAAAIDSAAAATGKVKKPRAPRKKAGAADAAASSGTPNIVSFLSPIVSSPEEESPPYPVASLDPLAPAEVLRKQLLKHRVRVEVADDGEVDLTSSGGGGSSGRIEFKSIKGNPALEALALKAPTIMASIIKCAEASAADSTSSAAADAYTVAPATVKAAGGAKKQTATIVERKLSQQSTLRGFVSQQSKMAAVVSAPSPVSSSSATKKPIPILPPSSRAKPAGSVSTVVPSTPAVAATAAASSPASTFSSTLSVCPLCSCAFSASMLQSHVNSCLDEQQEAQDAAMAQSISAEPPPPLVSAAAVLPKPSAGIAGAAGSKDADDDDDDFNLSADMAAQELVVVSDQSALSSTAVAASSALRARASSPPRSAAGSATSRSQSLTPQKRRKQGDNDAAPTAAAAAAAGAKPQPAVARTLIELLDSDDDDEQPGSTLYRSSKQRN